MTNLFSYDTNEFGIEQNGKSITGTKEWANKNLNCIIGCSNNCKYCYARAMASRYKRKAPDDWKNEEVNINKLPKTIRKVNGRIMFPSSHDITPQNLNVAFQALDKILVHNDVLIVTKPWLSVIKEICERYEDKKEQILFRFSIGTYRNDILKYWEPGASSYQERLESLKFAYEQGFKTSISIEPMLDCYTMFLINELLPYVTETIWLGLPKKLNQRLSLNGEDDKIALLSAWQLENVLLSPGGIMELFNKFRNHPQIRWKDSIRKVVERQIIERREV